MMTASKNKERWESYLGCRTGTYEFRRRRYTVVAEVLYENLGLTDQDLVVGVGAGWCEFGRHLYRDWGFHGRYLAVDGALDGTDLEQWIPQAHADFFVAIEVIEHLEDPLRLVRAMQRAATSGVVLTTPNPAAGDVLALDPTHKTPVRGIELKEQGFDVHLGRPLREDA